MPVDKRTLRKEASRKVEANKEDLIRITQELVRIPSVNPPGNYEGMVEKMVDLYQAEGLSPLVLSAPKEKIEELDLTFPRPNVVALFEGQTHSPVFCLDSHMDVVAVGDESRWKFPPFEGRMVGDRIYGRGAEDTKCHLAAQLIAVRAIKAAEIELKGDLILCATVDDEIGQWPGMGYLIERGFEENGIKRPDFHIAGEPTGIEQIACLARGRLWYEIVLKGLSAHGGNPSQGVNAIEKAIFLANAVRSFPIRSDPLMGKDTVNLGILRGGEAINVVPSRCTITFDIRPTTKTQVVKDFMERTLQRLKAKDPDFDVESIQLLNDRETGGIGPDHEFVRVLKDVVNEMTGKNPVATGSVAGYSSLGNAYWTSRNGVAGLMYGAGDFLRAHRTDEFIRIGELVEITKIFAGLIVELCA